MKYIATVLLLLMAISLIFSGALLWRRRKETGDYSRTIWAIFSWVSSIFALTFIMCTGIEYIPIYSYSDMWGNIGKFNVWFRLFALVLILLYSFALFLVPYDWSKSSADIQELFNYAGYRQRSTAWRNFQKVTGMTPAEFIEKHKRGPIL